MKLPEKIYLQVTNKKETKVKDIIVQLKVRSGTKNPYYIFFPKTDEDGESILSLNDFSGQFEDHFEAGLMDYNGSIKTANSEVEVSLFDPAWMKKTRKRSSNILRIACYVCGVRLTAQQKPSLSQLV